MVEFASANPEESPFAWTLAVGEETSDTLPIGSYTARAVGESTGRTLIEGTLEILCDTGSEWIVPAWPQFTLTLNVIGSGMGRVAGDGPGTACALGSCSFTLDRGTELRLEALADEPGSAFLGWSGACADATGPVCVVSIDRDLTVGAEFIRIDDSLQVALNGNGQGSVVSAPAGIDCSNVSGALAMNCSTSLRRGTVVELTAAPATGSTFEGWTGAACAGQGNPCRFELLASPVNVGAVFTLQRFPLSVQVLGSGTGRVLSAPGSGICSVGGTCVQEFDYGTRVTLTAQAEAGTELLAWGGSCSGAASTCEVEMTEARSVLAEFSRQELSASLIRSIGQGEQSVGQTAATALNFYIARIGTFPSRDTFNSTGSPLVGEVRMLASNFAPFGWVPCDGRELLISSNTALFSVIGTRFGGNGVTNFRVPDLRGRAAMGPGSLNTGGPLPPPAGAVSIVPTIGELPLGGMGIGVPVVLGMPWHIATTGIFPSREGPTPATGVQFADLMMFAGNFSPAGWLPCDGRLLSIASNTALFSLVGTFYGGDGRTTFALPNLNARLPMGQGSLGVPPIVPTSRYSLPNLLALEAGEVRSGLQVGVTGLAATLAVGGAFPSATGTLNTSGPFLGEVRFTAASFVPSGYRAANSDLLSIASNSALFSLLGTTYGGDGRTNFRVPDLRARIVVGAQ
jgi:microcystin-dependent protein